MPRFYFHVRDDLDAYDHEGREFTCFEQAVVQATHEARDLAAHDLRAGHLNLDHGLEIATEEGDVVLTMSFREVFTLQG